MVALTRAALDVAQCSRPGCTERHGPLILHSRCHHADPTWAEYDAATGQLRVFCATCATTIVRIQVAE